MLGGAVGTGLVAAALVGVNIAGVRPSAEGNSPGGAGTEDIKHDTLRPGPGFNACNYPEIGRLAAALAGADPSACAPETPGHHGIYNGPDGSPLVDVDIITDGTHEWDIAHESHPGSIDGVGLANKRLATIAGAEIWGSSVTGEGIRENKLAILRNGGLSATVSWADSGSGPDPLGIEAGRLTPQAQAMAAYLAISTA
jgi:hypothetical protein